MNITPPEKRRTKISTGKLPSFKTTSLTACHPFSQQLDLVFPSDPTLLQALEKLETSYGRGKTKLANLVHHSGIFIDSVTPQSNLLVVSASSPGNLDDFWCIDPSGYLTLSVSKESYERLGLVGRRLPFNEHKDIHLVTLPLQAQAQSATNTAKMKKNLEDWDKRRVAELGADLGPWDVLYCSKDIGGTPDLPGLESRPHIIQVRCEQRESRDVNIPVPGLAVNPRPTSPAKGGKSLEDEAPVEDWVIRMTSLFEWVGMAALGAQRLNANDRVNPYVAVYEPPAPSRVGNVTHLRWKGLLPPSFVQKILDTVMSSIQNSPSFISVTCHAYPNSPVSYIPSSRAESGMLGLPTTVPVKLPRSTAEDTWSLMLENSSIPNGGAIDWWLVESIGKWDTRWG